jgi:beta-N-acetylhexosaminidase
MNQVVPALTHGATTFRLLRRLVVRFTQTQCLINTKLISVAVCLSLFLSFANLSFAQQSKTQSSKAESTWIESTLKKLSLREKIGQMIVVRVGGEFTNFNSEKFAEVKKHIEQNKVGGVIIYRGDVNEIAALTNEMQRLAKIPLLIAADYERGLRMQLRSGTPFTTNMGVGASGDVQAAYRQGKIIAEEMRAIGVNWLYAPVADINNNPDNPVINIRSFGEEPVRVGEFVSALVKGVRDGGALSTVKHFPGHGDTATDSHIGLSVVPLDRTRLDKVELVPFRAAIAAGADSVMTAHVAVPKVTGDNTPTTLSPKMTNDLLRNELGFKGIVTTDAMEMGAIVKNYDGAQSSAMVVKAGADVVLLPTNTEETINTIEEAVKKNEITEKRINESVRRLLRAKYRLGLVQNRFVDLSRVNQIVERPENVKEANATAEKSITLLRNKDNFFPLTNERANKTLFVVIAADDESEEGRTFIPQIQARTKGRIIRTDPRTTKEEYEAILSSASEFDSIVLAPFVKRAALKGTVALPEKQTEFIRKMIAKDKPVAVIAFGSPYLIRQFSEVQTYVVTYAIEDVAQQAAVRVLFGEVPFAGKLPVSIPNLFEISAGIVKQ